MLSLDLAQIAEQGSEVSKDLGLNLVWIAIVAGIGLLLSIVGLFLGWFNRRCDKQRVDSMDQDLRQLRDRLAKLEDSKRPTP